MSHNAGLEGPEYVSAFADRLHANDQNLEAKVFHELATSWQQDRRTIAQLQSEASDAPNIGKAELEQLRTDAAAHRATLALRDRALALIPAANLRETHWIEALCDSLVQQRVLLKDALQRGQLQDDAPDDDAEGRDSVWRVEGGRVTHLAPDATESDRAEAESWAARQSAVLGAERTGEHLNVRVPNGAAQRAAPADQGKAVLDRALAAFNALYPDRPVTEGQALTLLTQMALATSAALGDDAPPEVLRAAA